MAKLKPWYQVVTPREDLRDNRPLDASEFAVHLDHIRAGRAHEDYVKPHRFFARTFMTHSLRDLLTQVVRRLSGLKVETSAVFNMATQFGGGKTHALAALYHLAEGGEAARSWKGVDALLLEAGVKAVPKAATAVFVGTEFDVIDGRGGDGEPLRKTPWGEIAWQLGGEQSFRAVAEHDARGIAPAGDVIRRMLPDGPAVILMDELLNYVSRGRKLGMRDQLFDFLQNLSEEARARDGVVLCVSIPKSLITEMSPEDEEDYTRLKNLLNRLGKAIMMSADTEVAEIIRRRLFEWEGLPAEAEKAAREYADWVAANAGALSGLEPETAYEQFRSSYPFHPSVLSVFERKWQALPRFQRTRGVLRLLALWVASAYREDHRNAYKEPLIGLGTAPIDDPMFRAAMFEQLGTNDLEGPATTDIAGRTDAHALRLDRESAPDIKKGRLHRKAATAILFESNGGQLKAEASIGEIKAALGGPDVNLADVDHVLEGLITSCYYVTAERNRYRFSLTPNINKILTDRRAAVQPKEIDERLRKEIEKAFGQGPKELDIDRRYYPARSNDIPDRAVLTLVVLGPDMTSGEAPTARLIEAIIRESGTSARTFKSGLLFASPDSATAMAEQARDVLAWEDINDDPDTVRRLDESQQRVLKQKVSRASADLREAIWRAYRHLYLLGKDNVVRQIDLGNITSSMATTIVEVYVNELTRRDEVTEAVGANQLKKYWPGAFIEWPTRGVRDAFFASPALPRLLKPTSLKRTIADGVTQGVLGYARKDSSGQMKLERFGESLAELEVELSDDVFILKEEDARKLMEPPRVTRLSIRPSHATLKPGERQAYSLEAFDQYGHVFQVDELLWSATGGEIGDDGVYVAGADSGNFGVHVVATTMEASVDVRISSETVPPPGPSASGTIAWRGAISPQKWMTFYTKVLSRFVNTPGLELEVSFEAPAEGDQARSKADEAKTALRELGLSEDVEIR
jgi:hypothetical protein